MVQVGKDQEKAQSENDSHSKNRGGENLINNQVRMSSYFPNSVCVVENFGVTIATIPPVWSDFEF